MYILYIFPYFQGELTFVLVTAEIGQMIMKYCSKIDNLRVCKTIIFHQNIIVLNNSHKCRERKQPVHIVSRSVFKTGFDRS